MPGRSTDKWNNFDVALSAVDLALRTLGLKERISVRSEESNKRIVLADTVMIIDTETNWEARGGGVVGKEIVYSSDEDIDTVVIEAVVQLVAGQVRDELFKAFGEVGDEL